MSEIYRKKAVCAVILTFVLMTSLGGVISGGMMMEDGMSHECGYMGMTAMCEMTPIQHLSEWQQMFSSIAHEAGVALLLLLLAFSIARFITATLYEPEQKVRFIPRYRYRERFFDQLRNALSRGIIHPKVF